MDTVQEQTLDKTENSLDKTENWYERFKKGDVHKEQTLKMLRKTPKSKNRLTRTKRLPPKTSTMLRTQTRKKERMSKSFNSIRSYMGLKASQYKSFTDLCEKDIMNTPLEFVYHKTWLSKGKVNIFIIGEVHSYRNYTEKGIFEMFDEFKTYMDIVGSLKEMFTVDIMLEISEGHTNRDADLSRPTSLPNSNDIQLDNVRALFRECIGRHNCGKIRAHWVDNMKFSYKNTYKTSTKFKLETNELETKLKNIPGLATAPPSWFAKPEVRTALAAMPEWLNTFYGNFDLSNSDYNLKGGPAAQLQDDMQGYRVTEKFKTREDLLKLLDENTIVLKEIDKAAKVQQQKGESPIFDRDFARSILKNVPEQTLFYVARCVMDIYTVARMIKSEMKNVIIYVGAGHAKRIVNILTKLGYEIKRQDVRLPLTPVKDPLPKPPLPDDWDDL